MLDRTKVAFNAFWFEGLDSDEKVGRVCEGLTEMGYKGVEWKETCFPPGNDIRSRLQMAVRASKAAGLEVTDFVILRNLGDADTVAKSTDEMCEFVRASAAAGVNVVNTGSVGVARKSVPDEDWWMPAGPDWTNTWDMFEKALGRVLKVAESEGVVVAQESIAGCLVHDYYSTRELLRRLDSPNLGVTFDPSHYVIHDNDVGWAIRNLADKIKHVHVKDAVGHPGAIGRDFLFPVLGEGATDWKEFFDALDDAGYDGWMAIEFESFKYMAQVLKNDGMEAARLSMRSYKALAGI